MAWKTVKQAGLVAGTLARAKTVSGAIVDALLKGPARAQRWYATNQATNKEVQVTKVWVMEAK